MFAIFTYGFKTADDNFTDANCNINTLCDYNIMIDCAKDTGYVKEEDVLQLKQWRKDPANWRK